MTDSTRNRLEGAILTFVVGIVVFVFVVSGTFVVLASPALIVIGILCNALVLWANGGYMPVALKGGWTAERVWRKEGRMPMTPESRCKPLADRIILPRAAEQLLFRILQIKAMKSGMKSLYSIGDLLLLSGFISFPLTAVGELIMRV